MVLMNLKFFASSSFTTFHIPSKWTVQYVSRSLKDPNSNLNRYLNWHKKDDEDRVNWEEDEIWFQMLMPGLIVDEAAYKMRLKLRAMQKKFLE